MDLDFYLLNVVLFKRFHHCFVLVRWGEVRWGELVFHTNHSLAWCCFWWSDHQSLLSPSSVPAIINQNSKISQSHFYPGRQPWLDGGWWWWLQCLPDGNVITWWLWWYDGPSAPSSHPPPHLTTRQDEASALICPESQPIWVIKKCRNIPRIQINISHTGIVFPQHSTLCPDYTIIQSRPPLSSEPELLQFTFLTSFCSRLGMLARD